MGTWGHPEPTGLFLAWGVRPTVLPFAKTKFDGVKIQAKVTAPKPGHGPGVRVMIVGLSPAAPMKLLDAQALQEALGVVIAEVRSVVNELRS